MGGATRVGSFTMLIPHSRGKYFPSGTLDSAGKRFAKIAQFTGGMLSPGATPQPARYHMAGSPHMFNGRTLNEMSKVGIVKYG